MVIGHGDETLLWEYPREGSLLEQESRCHAEISALNSRGEEGKIKRLPPTGANGVKLERVCAAVSWIGGCCSPCVTVKNGQQ